eukprot:TRINITY_DN6701_c0_g1_i1.p1 TRINITY_DN6701_c0_g1~~TRINITY_DN6701_c0_g1_i1.p1  ORF type:complete len:1445 (+),score=285.22 TRINITY_DN6701_c0_g1_i1:946-5280(+)
MLFEFSFYKMAGEPKYAYPPDSNDAAIWRKACNQQFTLRGIRDLSPALEVMAFKLGQQADAVVASQTVLASHHDWKKRYFVLRYPFIFYFKTNADGEPCCGCIYLWEASCQHVETMAGGSKGSLTCMRVLQSVPRRPGGKGGLMFTIGFNSKTVRDAWYEKICEGRAERLKEEGQVTPRRAEIAKAVQQAHQERCAAERIVLEHEETVYRFLLMEEEDIARLDAERMCRSEVVQVVRHDLQNLNSRQILALEALGEVKDLWRQELDARIEVLRPLLRALGNEANLGKRQAEQAEEERRREQKAHVADQLKAALHAKQLRKVEEECELKLLAASRDQERAERTVGLRTLELNRMVMQRIDDLEELETVARKAIRGEEQLRSTELRALLRESVEGFRSAPEQEARVTTLRIELQRLQDEVQLLRDAQAELRKTLGLRGVRILTLEEESTRWQLRCEEAEEALALRPVPPSSQRNEEDLRLLRSELALVKRERDMAQRDREAARRIREEDQSQIAELQRDKQRLLDRCDELMRDVSRLQLSVAATPAAPQYSASTSPASSVTSSTNTTPATTPRERDPQQQVQQLEQRCEQLLQECRRLRQEKSELTGLQAELVQMLRTAEQRLEAETSKRALLNQDQTRIELLETKNTVLEHLVQQRDLELLEHQERRNLETLQDSGRSLITDFAPRAAQIFAPLQVVASRSESPVPRSPRPASPRSLPVTVPLELLEEIGRLEVSEQEAHEIIALLSAFTRAVVDGMGRYGFTQPQTHDQLAALAFAIDDLDGRLTRLAEQQQQNGGTDMLYIGGLRDQVRTLAEQLQTEVQAHPLLPTLPPRMLSQLRSPSSTTHSFSQGDVCSDLLWELVEEEYLERQALDVEEQAQWSGIKCEWVARLVGVLLAPEGGAPLPARVVSPEDAEARTTVARAVLQCRAQRTIRLLAERDEAVRRALQLQEAFEQSSRERLSCENALRQLGLQLEAEAEGRATHTAQQQLESQIEAALREEVVSRLATSAEEQIGRLKIEATLLRRLVTAHERRNEGLESRYGAEREWIAETARREANRRADELEVAKVSVERELELRAEDLTSLRQQLATQIEQANKVAQQHATANREKEALQTKLKSLESQLSALKTAEAGWRERLDGIDKERQQNEKRLLEERALRTQEEMKVSDLEAQAAQLRQQKAKLEAELKQPRQPWEARLTGDMLPGEQMLASLSRLQTALAQQSHPGVCTACGARNSFGADAQACDGETTLRCKDCNQWCTSCICATYDGQKLQLMLAEVRLQERAARQQLERTEGFERGALTVLQKSNRQRVFEALPASAMPMRPATPTLVSPRGEAPPPYSFTSPRSPRPVSPSPSPSHEITESLIRSPYLSPGGAPGAPTTPRSILTNPGTSNSTPRRGIPQKYSIATPVTVGTPRAAPTAPHSPRWPLSSPRILSEGPRQRI